jgi:D-xylose transport system permease protein
MVSVVAIFECVGANSNVCCRYRLRPRATAARKEIGCRIAIAAAVIGGTSLFGGRGRVVSALLGALVIMTIANGLSLMGSSASTQYIITGVILLAAVTLDTVTRRRLEASGR